jgi:hypothetical protein
MTAILKNNLKYQNIKCKLLKLWDNPKEHEIEETMVDKTEVVKKVDLTVCNH